MKQVEDWLAPWIRYWHGLGSPDQYEFYRCQGCGALLNWKTIKKGGCTCNRGNRMRPAHVLTVWEKLKILLLPWTVTR